MSTTTKRKLDDLARLSNGELEKILVAGTTPDFAKLDGWIFRGWNVAAMASVLRIKKFAKGFFSDNGRKLGYNCPVKQSALESPWDLKPSNESPKRFGFYEVRATTPGERDHRYPSSLLLDYGRGPNPWYEVAKVLRDFVVRVDPDNDDLYLGKAYVALGPLRVFGGFFIIERLRKA